MWFMLGPVIFGNSHIEFSLYVRLGSLHLVSAWLWRCSFRRDLNDFECYGLLETLRKLRFYLVVVLAYLQLLHTHGSDMT